MQKPDSTNRQQTSHNYTGEIGGIKQGEIYNMQTPDATQRQQISSEYMGDISGNQARLTNFQEPKVTGEKPLLKIIMMVLFQR